MFHGGIILTIYQGIFWAFPKETFSILIAIKVFLEFLPMGIFLEFPTPRRGCSDGFFAETISKVLQQFSSSKMIIRVVHCKKIVEGILEISESGYSTNSIP